MCSITDQLNWNCVKNCYFTFFSFISINYSDSVKFWEISSFFFKFAQKQRKLKSIHILNRTVLIWKSNAVMFRFFNFTYILMCKSVEVTSTTREPTQTCREHVNCTKNGSEQMMDSNSGPSCLLLPPLYYLKMYLFNTIYFRFRSHQWSRSLKNSQKLVSNMMHALRAALQETKICNSMRRFGRSCA